MLGHFGTYPPLTDSWFCEGYTTDSWFCIPPPSANAQSAASAGLESLMASSPNVGVDQTFSTS
jgi:hypothetical protein